jgi:hypothetical protein
MGMAAYLPPHGRGLAGRNRSVCGLGIAGTAHGHHHDGLPSVLLVAGGGIYLGRRLFSLSPSSASGTAGAPSTLPPVGTGYLATGPDFVDFIQWNDSNSNLSRSAQAVTTRGQAHAQLSSAGWNTQPNHVQLGFGIAIQQCSSEPEPANRAGKSDRRKRTGAATRGAEDRQ